MQRVIISDTSCLILLDKIGELDLLNKLFREVIVTQEIAEEFGKSLPEWLKIEHPINRTYQRILEASLDKGEASAIAYAIEQNDCLLIIDDFKGSMQNSLEYELQVPWELSLRQSLAGTLILSGSY